MMFERPTIMLTVGVLSCLTPFGSGSAGELSVAECAALQNTLTTLAARDERNAETMQALATLTYTILSELNPTEDGDLIGVANEMKELITRQSNLEVDNILPGIAVFKDACSLE